MIAVIAQNKDHARHFARQSQIHKYDWHYISCPDQMRGMVGSDCVVFVRLPDWYIGRPPDETAEIDALIDLHHKKLGRKG